MHNDCYSPTERLIPIALHISARVCSVWMASARRELSDALSRPPVNLERIRASPDLLINVPKCGRTINQARTNRTQINKWLTERLRSVRPYHPRRVPTTDHRQLAKTH